MVRYDRVFWPYLNILYRERIEHFESLVTLVACVFFPLSNDAGFRHIRIGECRRKLGISLENLKRITSEKNDRQQSCLRANIKL